MSSQNTISRSEAKAFYNRVGRWQDTQTFYEAPACDALIAHGQFDEAHSLFEIGCGTGRLAERLLNNHCPSRTRYVGVDLSPTMVRIARDRLSSFGNRAEVRQTDRDFSYRHPPDSVDRVLATYVLDVLSGEDIQALLSEAGRLLGPEGRLCLAGLTWGNRPMGQLVSAAWDAIHGIRPTWVGGCRPLRMRPILSPAQWRIVYHDVVQAWGVPSEVLIARPT